MLQRSFRLGFQVSYGEPWTDSLQWELNILPRLELPTTFEDDFVFVESRKLDKSGQINIQSVHRIQISLLSLFFEQLCLWWFIFHILVFFRKLPKIKVHYFKRIKPSLFELNYESIGPFYISKVYDGILMTLSFLSLKTFHYFIILEFISSLFIYYFQIYYLEDFLYFNIKMEEY